MTRGTGISVVSCSVLIVILSSACCDAASEDRISEEVAVVTHEYPSDPFRPQVKILRGRDGSAVGEMPLVNTWEPNGRGDFTWAVVEAVDPDEAGIDPLQYMQA